MTGQGMHIKFLKFVVARANTHNKKANFKHNLTRGVIDVGGSSWSATCSLCIH